jgi:hypothetical protein
VVSKFDPFAISPLHPAQKLLRRSFGSTEPDMMLRGLMQSLSLRRIVVNDMLTFCLDLSNSDAGVSNVSAIPNFSSVSAF